MENGNISDFWKGIFEATDGGTQLICAETVTAKRWWMRPFVHGYLKRKQKLYLVSGRFANGIVELGRVTLSCLR